MVAANYPGDVRMDHRRGTDGQSGPGEDHEGEAADGQPAACGWCASATSTCSPAAARTSAPTGEIGRLAIGKIESKGKQNRRIRVRFAE